LFHDHELQLHIKETHDYISNNVWTNLYSVKLHHKFSKFEHCNSNSNFTCVTFYQRGYTFNKRRLRNLEMIQWCRWNRVVKFYIWLLCTNFSSVHFNRNFRYLHTVLDTTTINEFFLFNNVSMWIFKYIFQFFKLCTDRSRSWKCNLKLNMKSQVVYHNSN